MRTKSVSSAWMRREGRRLDCGPYMSGALEAKLRLETLSAPKMALKDVTLGSMKGIVNAGRFKRLWVANPEHGRPFLSSSDILHADLSNLPLISHKAVSDSPQLLIHAGWTLITRSGTIGRMVFARPDMDGMACSEHVLRVIPDEARIPPGYLYAYLSSKFGVPLVVSGTYGAIIQHIEPHHIGDLPVPRLSESLEERAHALIEEAAHARSRAAELKRKGVSQLNSSLGLSELQRAETSTSFATFDIASSLLSRLDAAHFSAACRFASRELSESAPTRKYLGDIASVFTPGIFKRPFVDDEAHGFRYFSGSELFQYGPTPRGFLAKKAVNIREYLVQQNWLLVQDAGQLGGLIGRVVRVSPDIAGGVVSNHLMRIAPKSDLDGAYLFAILSSPHGYRAVTRHAFGTSIPQLDPKHIAGIEIPWPDPRTRENIGTPILEAWSLEDRALEAECEGVAIVERAIEEAS